jgi:hypothetical protein
MVRTTVIALLITAIVTSLIGFPFESADAHAWAGSSFTVFAIVLMMAGLLLAIDSARNRDDLATAGFVAIALYGFGTALNSSLIARGLPELSVGIQPGIWLSLAIGLAFLSLSSRFSVWVRIAGIFAASGHAAAAFMVLFGSEMPHTGASPTELAPALIAFSKILFWILLVGWILHLRTQEQVDSRERSVTSIGRQQMELP